jgi:hypothetical protein
MDKDIASILSVVGPLITVIASVTVLITFKRNSKDAAVKQGAKEQAQVDKIEAINGKIDNLRTEVMERFDSVEGELKNLNARMEKESKRMTIIATQHALNHPGQKID